VIATIGIAVDARMATRTRDPQVLARATRWIAANLIAVRGQRPLLLVRVESLADLLARIAVEPVLVDHQSLPARWRLALRLAGVPFVDDTAGVTRLSLAPIEEDSSASETASRRSSPRIGLGFAAGSYRVVVREPSTLAA
jgi:hypothetical protein